MKFIEFNTATVVVPTNLTVYLSGDAAVGIDGRSVNNIKFYASTSAGTIMDNLSADIALNADYNGTYGSQYVEVQIDLNSVTGQYFRLEFNQPGNGARIREIDAFIE